MTGKEYVLLKKEKKKAEQNRTYRNVGHQKSRETNNMREWGWCIHQGHFFLCSLFFSQPNWTDKNEAEKMGWELQVIRMIKNIKN